MPDIVSSGIHSAIERLVDRYSEAKAGPFSGSQFGSFVRKEIPDCFYATGLVPRDRYLVTGSVGQGNWATVPWICIFDRSITTSATKGVYVVYLLSKDTNTLYLTFNQGCTDIRSSHSKRDTIQIMRDNAKIITQDIDCSNFQTDENINLGDGLTELAELYQRGAICYKAYHKGAIPAEEELRKDLASILQIYQQYVKKKNGLQEDEWWPTEAEYSPGISKSQWLGLLKNEKVFIPNALSVMASFYGEGGQATCAQLGAKYGNGASFYIMTSIHLAERVIRESGCAKPPEEMNSKLWPVLYTGKNAVASQPGAYIWRLRPELYEALTEFGIERYLPAQAKTGVFDSWEIIDENTAVKTCDKSFFDYNGSGVPKDICWFFGADALQQGETLEITFQYLGEQYTGRIANESSDRRRVRIFWSSELGKRFAEKRSENAPKAVFTRLEENSYAISFRNTDGTPKRAWLLTWNPNNYQWEDYRTAASKTQLGEPYKYGWTCASKQVQPGDRVFLVALGMGSQNGIVASGFAASASYEEEHWDPEKDAQGIKAKYIDVDFDWISDYSTDPYLKIGMLTERFPEQKWNPMGSGISIKDQYVDQLEAEWAKITQAGGEEKLTVKDAIGRIKAYIAAKGFRYEDGLVENFYLSLKAKPFVILAGTSGTGKTRLVKLFAEAIGATGNRYQMVSVRPDWSDSTDLFGHVDLNGRFIPGAILDFVKRAELDTGHPYILCLDEMNLARVEYYLSDILSVIETREFDAFGNIVTDSLIHTEYYGSDGNAAGKYGTVRLPENLYIVGTVNMDETTFPFSKKVLDRANTIEFSRVDLTLPGFSEETPVQLSLPNSFLKTNYLLLKQCMDEADVVSQYCAELQEINKILAPANAHVGYRVRDEIVFYLLNNHVHGLLPEDVAMDNEIMQKILPRIQGSSASVKNLLCELFKRCAGDFEGYGTGAEDLSKKMLAVTEKPGCKYRNSARKIADMVRRFEEDGFTSYWL